MDSMELSRGLTCDDCGEVKPVASLTWVELAAPRLVCGACQREDELAWVESMEEGR